MEHFVLQLLLIFFASDMGFRRLREDGIIPEWLYVVNDSIKKA